MRADADRALFDRAVAEFEHVLPGMFSLTAEFMEPSEGAGSDGDGSGAPPEFTATYSPEGLLQLRGGIADKRAQRAVEGFARAHFSHAKVHQAMKLDSRLSGGWANRILAGLQALSLLNSGLLVVQAGSIEIRGNSSDPEAHARLSGVVSRRLGEAAYRSIAVNHVEPSVPQPKSLTPRECLEAINVILAAGKISFEPSSAEIRAEGIAAIDRISKVVRECPAARMEIAGHTDSQGRASMNQQLSQQRAEAVLAALQARRVLTGNLVPAGYGESSPIADNGTEDGREANRRIEFTLLVPDG